MPSNNSKYTDEIREQTTEFILETGESVTSLAEEIGIDTNPVHNKVKKPTTDVYLMFTYIGRLPLTI